MPSTAGQLLRAIVCNCFQWRAVGKSLTLTLTMTMTMTMMRCDPHATPMMDALIYYVLKDKYLCLMPLRVKMLSCEHCGAGW